MFKGSSITVNDVNSAAQVANHGLLKYPHRLNLCGALFMYSSFRLKYDYLYSYDVPPTFDVTIEEFETCALDRLRILAEIESSAARNRTAEELKDVTLKQSGKYLPLNISKGSTGETDGERRRDHLSHFVLRLAFCRS